MRSASSSSQQPRPTASSASSTSDVRRRSFEPRAGAHALDVDDPYYGDPDDFEDVFAVIEAALPGLHDWVDERLGQNGQT